MGALASLSPVRFRRKEGRISFDEETVEGDRRDSSAKLVGFFKSDDTGNRDREAEVKHRSRCRRVFSETVKNAPYSTAVWRELRYDLRGRCAAMDDEGVLGRLCESYLPLKPLLLAGEGRISWTIEVKARFANSDDLGMTGKSLEFVSIVGLVCVAGVNTDRSDNAWKTFGESNRVRTRSNAVAGTDGDDARYSRSVRAVDYLLQILRKVGRTEMGMGINDQAVDGNNRFSRGKQSLRSPHH